MYEGFQYASCMYIDLSMVCIPYMAVCSVIVENTYDLLLRIPKTPRGFTNVDQVEIGTHSSTIPNQRNICYSRERCK